MRKNVSRETANKTIEILMKEPKEIFNICSKENSFGIDIYRSAQESLLFELFKVIDEEHYANMIFLIGLEHAEGIPRKLILWTEEWSKKDIDSALFVAMQVIAAVEDQTIKSFVKKFHSLISLLPENNKQRLINTLDPEYREPGKSSKREGAGGKSFNFTFDGDFSSLFNESSNFKDQIEQVLKSFGLNVDSKKLASKFKNLIESITGKKYSEEDIMNFKWFNDLPEDFMKDIQNPQKWFNMFTKTDKTSSDDKDSEDKDDKDKNDMN